MSRYIFTSESVTKGHPDKVCDIISDSVLDAYLEKDSHARVAIETVVKNNTVVLAGEISSKVQIDVEKVVRSTIKSIGYNRPELGFDGDTAKIIQIIDSQSPDIAQGVDEALEIRGKDEEIPQAVKEADGGKGKRNAALSSSRRKNAGICYLRVGGSRGNRYGFDFHTA